MAAKYSHLLSVTSDDIHGQCGGGGSPPSLDQVKRRRQRATDESSIHCQVVSRYVEHGDTDLFRRLSVSQLEAQPTDPSETTSAVAVSGVCTIVTPEAVSVHQFERAFFPLPTDPGRC